MRPSAGDIDAETTNVGDHSLILAGSAMGETDKTVIANEVTQFMNDNPEVGDWSEEDV